MINDLQDLDQMIVDWKKISMAQIGTTFALVHSDSFSIGKRLEGGGFVPSPRIDVEKFRALEGVLCSELFGLAFFSELFLMFILPVPN